MGFADSPPVDYILPKLSIIMGELPTLPQFRFMVSVTRFPTDVGFLIHRVSLLSAAWIQYVSARWHQNYIKYFPHLIALCNASCVYALQ